MAKKRASKKKVAKRVSKKAPARRPSRVMKAAAASPPHGVVEKPLNKMEAARRVLARRADDARAERVAAFRDESRRERRAIGLDAKGRLRLLAEGDSWFDYPARGGVALPGVIDEGVIPELQSMLSGKARILNLAHYGDEIRGMMSCGQQERLREALVDRSLGTFDAILISGGGNDIAGDQFSLWLNKFEGQSWQQAMHNTRFENVLDIVRIGFEELVALRNELAPQAWIFANAYDLPRVSGRGVCGQGPWLKPSLEFRGWKNPDDQFNIVSDMLRRFRDAVASFASTGNRFVVVETQGTLDPDTEWANEIHPTKAGFRKVAGRFRDALAQVFPGKV
ncbi:MAG TPA: hypothetical protein VD971_11570 [Phycisphaerales bacterium]|nr:hypothetical protein [Phycisphaerales bacterium]